MFNTMNFVKVAGSVLGAFLFLLLVSWASTSLFTIGGAHDEDEAEHVAMSARPGDLLDDGEDNAAAEEEEVVEIVLGTGDAGKGEKLFGKCKACHKLDGTDATGPHLNGIVGRAVASSAGFGYSDAMAGHGGEWTLEALDAWIANPKEYLPGNKMSFAGLKKPEDRNNLITYLQSVQ